MAIPTRQWTSNLAALIIIILFGATSCADKIKTSNVVYKATDESLILSSTMLNNAAIDKGLSLEQKLGEPFSAESAKIWYPKQQQIQKQTDSLCNYIDELRNKLKAEAGLRKKDPDESFKESDKNAVMRLFNKQKKAQDLYDHLQRFKKDILGIDPQITKEFNKSFIAITRDFDDSKKDGSDFMQTFFDDIPTVAALAILSKFQNNARVIEYRMSSFCDSKVPKVSLVTAPSKKEL